MGTSYETQIARSSRAVELRQQGWTYQQIALELGCHHRSVGRLLKRVDQHALRRLEGLAEAEKRAQVAELQELFAAAVEGWERSREDIESRVLTSGRVQTLRSGDMVALPDLVLIRRRQQSGNPQYLLAALAAKSALRELLGLNAPKSVEVTTEGEPVVLLRGVDLDQL